MAISIERVTGSRRRHPPQIELENRSGIERGVEAAASVTALAAKLGVSHKAIYKFIRGLGSTLACSRDRDLLRHRPAGSCQPRLRELVGYGDETDRRPFLAAQVPCDSCSWTAALSPTARSAGPWSC